MKEKRKILVKRITIIISVLTIITLIIIGIVAILQSNTSKDEMEIQIETLLNNDISQNENTEELPIAEIIYQNMSYEVTKVKDGTCTISVTAPNMNILFFEVFDPNSYGKATSMEEYNSNVNSVLEQISTKLSKGEFEYITNTVEVPLNEEGQIEITYELVDALYGGLLSVQEIVLNNYAEDGKNA